MSSGITLNSSTALSSSSTLTNTGASGQPQITGLASGINTDQLIQAELAVKEEPMNNMAAEISGLKTENSSLSTIQQALQIISSDAMMLGEPSLFFNVQGVQSSNSSLVSAATTNGPGAVVGSTTVAVSQLASAAQRTFAYTTPAADQTVTIDGQQLTITAGETATNVASAINHSNSLDVYATTTVGSDGSTQLVLSSRSTGNNDNGSGVYINVQDGSTQVSGTGTYGTTGYVAGSAGTVLTEVGSLAQEGADAEYSLNGGPTQYATSDTVTNALPGLTLTLTGVTGPTPVTITAEQPGPDTNAIMSAISQFVADYNQTVAIMESDIDTAPASEGNASLYNPNSGSLFGDDELESILSSMRTTMYSGGAGLPAGLASLLDIGISTGSSNGVITSGGVNGRLQVNTAALQAALTSNPSGVEAVLQGWSGSFQTLVNNSASPAGAISARINGNQSLISDLQNQYDSMQTMFQQEEASMEQQWAQVEAALENLNNQKTTLTTFSNSLTSSDSSSSSSS